MSVLASAHNIMLEFPAKKVLDGVSFGIHEGDRIGIVGINGDGKSTLLKVLSKHFTPDSGEVIYNGNPLVGVLEQTDHLDNELSVKDAIVGTISEHSWASDKRIREIIANLVDDVFWDGQVCQLSGGQRRRVDLARLLIKDWDILMLDEPTNHLDMKTITWLSQHLKTRWPKKAGALLVVTHDRWFLDEIALRMWEVHDGQVELFEGGFAAYIQQRAERERVAQLSEEKRQNMIRKELAWLSRGARARSTKPKFHLKEARELIANDPPLRNSLELKQTAMARLGKQVFELENISKSYGEVCIFENINWLIGPGERIGLLGENGSGKSTLLGIIAQKIAPSTGRLKVGKTVKVAMLSQQLSELADMQDDRVREVVSRYNTRVTIDGKEMGSTALLERLGFQNEHFQSLVRDLSGGQKRRLQLLLTLMAEPNVLILDEPGNDMDTDMLAIMEDVLDSWPGTLLIVSHDRYLVERVSDSLFALIGGGLRQIIGGVDEYFALLDAHDNQDHARPKADKAKKPHQNQQEKRGEKFFSGAELHKARKELGALERKIANQEKQEAQLYQDMTQLDPSDYVALEKIERQRKDLRLDIEALENQWLNLLERIPD